MTKVSPKREIVEIIQAGPFVMVFSSLTAIMPLLRGKSTYPGCLDFRNHLFQDRSHATAPPALRQR